MATQDAVVLTSTGANGAFEVGVLKGLLGGKWGKNPRSPIQPYCYSGTSTGALNAAMVVSMGSMTVPALLQELERIWVKEIAASSGSATGMFRIRWDPTQYAHPTTMRNLARPLMDLALDSLHVAQELTQRVAVAASRATTLVDGITQLGEFGELLDVAPLRQLVTDYVKKGHILADGAPKLRITAVDWLRGLPRTFTNSDFDNAWAEKIIVAALALPGVMQAETVDGQQYVDSCVLFDHPLKPAIEAAENGAGPLVLHVIYVDANVRDIPLPPIPSTFSSLYRLYMLALSRAVLSDIARADSVNERIWMKRMLELVLQEAGRGASNKGLTADLTSSEIQKRADRDLTGKRTITIHRYVPKEHVSGFEIGQYNKDTIQQFIRHGYDVALHHDCAEAGCLLPDEARPFSRIT